MNFLQSFINNTFNDRQPKYKSVLDPDNKCELKKVTFNENQEQLNHSCPITMKKFKNGDIITILPCKHLFETESIEEWLLNNQAKCPVCRHELKNIKEICTTPELLESNVEQPNNTQNYDSISGNLPQLNNEWNDWRIRNVRQYQNDNSLSNGQTPQYSPDRIFSQILRNVLATNSINELQNEIPNNEMNGDLSNNISDADANLDPIYNNINIYMSMIDNILNRQVRTEENDVMQEAILASLHDQ